MSYRSSSSYIKKVSRKSAIIFESVKNIRQFYRIYSVDQIGETVFPQSENVPAVASRRKVFLSWLHYLKLMRIENVERRHFYEIEAVKIIVACPR